MNEVLIYGPIYDFTAELFVQSMNEIDADSVTLRINTGGGGVESGWSMIGRFQEFSGTKNVKVDGKAYSMGAFICLYADNVECMDISQFMFHRASYGAYFEKEYMSEVEKGQLANVNKKLREAFEAKIDVAKFEALKVCKDNGITVNRLFSMDERVDVYLTADEAKKIGLVKKVNKITPEKAASINSKLAQIAASHGVDDLMVKAPEVVTVQETTTKQVINSQTNMTIAELQAQHPELYAQVLQSGVAKERERVGAWSAFHEIDAKRVLEGIASGNDLSQKEIAEFSVTAMKAGSLATLNNENKAAEEKGGSEAKEEKGAGATDKVAELTASIIGKKSE